MITCYSILVCEYLNEVNIQRLVCRARSPDLNEIEHILAQLKLLSSYRNPEFLVKLEIEFKEENSTLQKLFATFSKAFKDV